MTEPTENELKASTSNQEKFQDNEVLQAQRRAFDHPTQGNLELLVLAAYHFMLRPSACGHPQTFLFSRDGMSEGNCVLCRAEVAEKRVKELERENKERFEAMAAVVRFIGKGCDGVSHAEFASAVERHFQNGLIAERN